MNSIHVQQLESEIGAVERLLEETPESAIIMRKSWEYRLEELQNQLAAAKEAPQATPLIITFRGRPVDGTDSIDANFAGLAVSAFVDAANTVTASLLVPNLRDRGPLPSSGTRELRITDTAIGSFGFQLVLPPQEPSDQQDVIEDDEGDLHVAAVKTTLQLLDRAARDDEEAISDLVAEVAPRAAGKVRDFAQVLEKHGAVFAATFGTTRVNLETEEQVTRAVNSLSEADISEKTVTYQGTLVGILPNARQFEIETAEQTILKGRIDRSLTDLSDFKRQWEDRTAQFRLRVIQVRASTRYILLGAEPRN